MPLILPIELICNTPDDQLIANVTANSRLPNRWQETMPAHDGVAILCGSGPSLADGLDEIRQIAWHREGRIFAMNGAAKYLASVDIHPDYQVIVDPRPETAALIGPAHGHLFASQCHPSLFDLCPTAIVWHQEIGGLVELLPDDRAAPDGCFDCVLIGGAGSVGNSACCLAFAMGFRELHLFGYDSSHRGVDLEAAKGHAFAQPLNDGDPCAFVRWRGREYLCSLTMKLQAETFIGRTAPSLQAAGARIAVHGKGLLPDMFNSGHGGFSEVEKYREMWRIPGYRTWSPGEDSAQKFVETAGVTSEDRVIDLGCGTGRGGAAVRRLVGCKVVGVDFVCVPDNALHHVIEADLTENVPLIGYTIGFCCDVLEHIPPGKLAGVIGNIFAAVPRCFFRIDFQEDTSGAFIGEVLHLSVYDASWWGELFVKLGLYLDWSEEHDGFGYFLVRRLDA